MILAPREIANDFKLNGFSRTTGGLAWKPYGPYSYTMAVKTYGAEEARTLLPELLERAHAGSSMLITKRGKPYAALVPVDQVKRHRVGLVSLKGTGRGLWGPHPAQQVDQVRDEWP